VNDLFAIAQTTPRAVPSVPGLGAAGDVGAAGSLDKDDFLKILLTQLTHQDPTQPMGDREFVAQMAQFSTLEQMTNLNTEMARVAGIVGRGQALQLLGKVVEVEQGDALITGTVEEISGIDFPQLLVSGRYYQLDSVRSIILQPTDLHSINERGSQP
jgi:flagellar basal-body rod modification protein FlgD